MISSIMPKYIVFKSQLECLMVSNTERKEVTRAFPDPRTIILP